jgi:hypothetical protein
MLAGCGGGRLDMDGACDLYDGYVRVSHAYWVHKLAPRLDHGSTYKSYVFQSFVTAQRTI